MSLWSPSVLGPAQAASWRAARPFPHLVIDDLLPPARLEEVRQAFAREPHRPGRGELYEMMASGDTLAQPALRDFAADLGAPASLAAVAAATGRAVTRVEVRGYVYLAGSYLLPHSDAGPDAGRQVAFAYYLLPSSSFQGGELELFACDLAGGEIVATAPALRIEPRENRVVLFEVSPVSLHQVREVTAGGRCSLAGWFL